MSHRLAKKCRKLVIGTGSEAAAAKHVREYAIENPARPVRVTLEYPVVITSKVRTLMDSVKGRICEPRVKQKAETTLLLRDGTRACIGQRGVYKALYHRELRRARG